MDNQIIPLRAHAATNRKRLLDVAQETLAEDPDASLNSIAKAAEVGAGTLYRHFPTREALIVAVYRAEIETIAALAYRLTSEMDAIEAFRCWCHRLITHVASRRGFADVLRAAQSEEEKAATHRPIAKAIGHLLQTAALSQRFTADVEPGDIQLLLSFIWQIRTAEGEQRAYRCVELIIRGLGGN